MSRPRGRPFQPGNKFGQGRPKGSPNKEKPASQKIMDDYAEHVVRKCIALAMQGDRSALRICMERISPARRDQCVRVVLPKIQTAKDINRAAEMITKAIRLGQITPLEGETLMNILESRSRVIEKVDFENRLERIEEVATRLREGKP